MNITLRTVEGFSHVVKVTNTVYNAPYGIDFYHSVYPTQNCQVFSLAPLSSLSYLNNEEIVEFFKEFRAKCNESKTLCLFDVRQNKFESLISAKFEVVCSSHYVSINGSNMVTGIIRIPNPFKIHNNEEVKKD